MILHSVNVEMYQIKIHNRIHQIIALFHYFNLWQKETQSSFREVFWKLFYISFYVHFLVSIGIGAVYAVNKEESIFLSEIFLTGSVITMKLIYILWKKKDILAFTEKLGIHMIEDCGTFDKVNNKLKNFMKFMSCYMCLIISSVPLVTMSSFVTNEKRLPLNVAFPMDWKHNELVYCVAFAYVTIGIIFSVVFNFLSNIIWYIMMNYCIKYEVLLHQLRNIGNVNERNLEVKELTNAYENHKFIHEYNVYFS